MKARTSAKNIQSKNHTQDWTLQSHDIHGVLPKLVFVLSSQALIRDKDGKTHFMLQLFNRRSEAHPLLKKNMQRFSLTAPLDKGQDSLYFTDRSSFLCWSAMV